eukprot:4554070-Alexandrium_andersonii.AAC.1
MVRSPGLHLCSLQRGRAPCPRPCTPCRPGRSICCSRWRCYRPRCPRRGAIAGVGLGQLSRWKLPDWGTPAA